MEAIVVERSDGGVVTVTMDRPEKKNAMTATMWHELTATFQEVAGSATDRVLVITGAGGDFCSGADLTVLQGDDDRHFWRRTMNLVTDTVLALSRVPQPTIAKVQGVAVGAGCNLALLCDLVAASEDARFSEIFAKRGLSIDFGGSWVLPRLVGLHRAKELALLADIIGARDAEALGLVNRVVPAGELDAVVADWADRLAAGPPLALAYTKRLLDQSFTSSLQEALEAEGLAQAVNLGTDDVAEAMRAFVQKRDARFEGR